MGFVEMKQQHAWLVPALVTVPLFAVVATVAAVGLFTSGNSADDKALEAACAYQWDPSSSNAENLAAVKNLIARPDVATLW